MAATNSSESNWGSSWHLVVPYSAIFALSVAGNAAVIATLAVNRRMRTVTNAFLVNLAVGDLLLGVFCMPFTLAGHLYREFLFGSALCKLIPYCQAVSVSVSAWTLVSMSVERYFAICHPLRSRRWQTLSHAYRTIGLVWIASFVIMLPIPMLSELQTIGATGKMKCRESWPSLQAEQAFTIFLDVALLLVPLALMTATYSLIIRTLWRAAAHPPGHKIRYCWNTSPSLNRATLNSSMGSSIGSSVNSAVSSGERGVLQKRRVVQMLFVVVLEFFVCWSPLYAVNTAALFAPAAVYGALGYSGVSLLQLLAYTSSCCNPLTYCFMNARFRDSFKDLIKCRCNART